MLLTFSPRRVPRVSRAFSAALDEDKDNVVSRAEIIEWIKDERYLNTPMWQDGSLKNACEDLLRRIGKAASEERREQLVAPLRHRCRHR